jgi:hypothetical protein
VRGELSRSKNKGSEPCSPPQRAKPSRELSPRCHDDRNQRKDNACEAHDPRSIIRSRQRRAGLWVGASAAVRSLMMHAGAQRLRAPPLIRAEQRWVGAARGTRPRARSNAARAADRAARCRGKAARFVAIRRRHSICACLSPCFVQQQSEARQCREPVNSEVHVGDKSPKSKQRDQNQKNAATKAKDKKKEPAPVAAAAKKK